MVFSSSETESGDEGNLQESSPTVPPQKEQKAMTSNQKQAKDIGGENVHHYSVETYKKILAESLSTKHADENFELKREKFAVHFEKRTERDMCRPVRGLRQAIEKWQVTSQEEQKAKTNNQKETKDISGKNVHRYPDGTEIKRLNFVLVPEKYTDISQKEQKATTSNQKETKDIGGKNVHYYPDETRKEFHADGSLSTKHADGKFEFKAEKCTDTPQKGQKAMSSEQKATNIIFNNVHHYHLDEIKTEIQADGSIIITYPDGKLEHKTEKYTYTKFKDGSTQKLYVNGHRIFKRIDGFTHITQRDGTKHIRYPNGTFHIVERNRIKTSIYRNKMVEIWADTFMMREFPNGKVVHYYLDGSELHQNPDPEDHTLLEDKDHNVLYRRAYINGKFQCCSNRGCLLFLTL